MAPLMDQRIESVLETVQKPSRYIGGEANQVRKPQATTLVALCYPDAYEIGISNQALQILYTQVNAREARRRAGLLPVAGHGRRDARARACRCSRSSRGGRCARPTCWASRCRPS